MQAPFDFLQDTGLTGFRLERLEVFNWGTFHGKIWSIDPIGGTSLLTGANGSGKSTLVDALLTLLVPNTRRGYNLASGASSKKERNERSYVRGAFGKYKGEEDHQSQTRFLRDKNDYSVLLAIFSNGVTRQKVTLSQVFYTQNDSLQKFFVVAPNILSVNEHFSGFSSVSTLKRSLRAQGADVYDQFTEYSKQFCRSFGLRSDKALDLFNQTVSIKAIKDLNSFVRGHMLEAADIEPTIEALRRHFGDLTHTYEAIRQARQQRDMLRPLVKTGQQYESLSDEVRRTAYCFQALPGYFARCEIGLLGEALDRNGETTIRAKRDLEVAGKTLGERRTQERDLEIAISKDSAGQEIQSIEQEIERRARDRDRIRSRWESFQHCMVSLKWAVPEDQKTFDALLDRARSEKSRATDEFDASIPERDDLVTRVANSRENIRVLEHELTSLHTRKSQIPAQNLEIRQRLLDALHLDAEALPFTGELIRVKEGEKDWEGAIERLLHSFALRIIVPEAHYERVNDFVNREHLNGRIVYARVPAARASRSSRDDDPNRLYNKLDIKPDSPYYQWLDAEIVQGFDHLCCGVEDIRHQKRALTREGLVKQNSTLHEKNDRHRIDDPGRYVLGWNNREKIRAIEHEISALTKRQNAWLESQRAIESRQQALQKRRDLLTDALRFTHFTEIDWHRVARTMQELEDQKKRLEASADHLQQLRKELEQVRSELQDAEQSVKRHESEITLLNDEKKRFEKRRAQCNELLQLFPIEKLEEYVSELEKLLEHPLELESLADEQQRMSQLLDNQKQTLQEKKSRVATRLVSQMKEYIHTYDITEVDAAPESLPDFQRFLDTIEKEDLPQHEKKFRDLLKTKLMEDISFFEHALFRQEEEIHDKVNALNKSLHPIPYTPSTYIQLHAKPTLDVEIREFKRLLRDVFDGHTPAVDAHESIFHKINNLIQRFNEDDRWTRKVTDVRFWLDFHISERSSESDKEINYITDSAGLSGGQKAKLAYTILASAIAYQYGLDYGDSQSDSFRFVVIDEAFSKIDESNARYAMELFRKLDLQLLVVSPLGSTRVVEDYITACHFVANNTEGNDSQVRNLTIAEYMEEKERLAIAAGLAA